MNRFVRSASDPALWLTTAAMTDRIHQNGNTYTLQRQNGWRYRFEKLTAGGISYMQLQDITDSKGNVYTLEYDTQKRLVKVTEPAGRYLQIVWQNLEITKVEFTLLATVNFVPPANQWSQINLNLPASYQFRYLRYIGPNGSHGNISEIELYADANGPVLTGTPFGVTPATEPGREYDKAFDGDSDTFFDSAQGTGAFTGLDMGAGNPQRLAMIRFYPRPGFESRVSTGSGSPAYSGQFQGANESPQTISAIAQVITSDNRSVSYQYQAIDDPTLPYRYQGLVGALYGDGTAAVYSYYQVFETTRPLLASALDPRYAGEAANMRYEYFSSVYAALGTIKHEKNGVDGQIMATLGTDNGNGSKPKVTYPNGRVVIFQQNLSQLSVKTDGLGRKTEISYADNGYGFVTARKDPLGRITQYTRSAFGSPLTVTHSDGAVETWTRDDLDLPLTHTDELGRTTTYTRDVRHRVIRVDHPDQSFEEFTYNDFGNRTSIINELGHAWTSHYDEFKRLTATTDPLNHTTSYGYDVMGGPCGCSHTNNKPTSIVLPSGKTTMISYDAEWQKISETLGAGTADAATTSYTYDAAGNLKTVIDPLGHATTFSYDNRNRRSTAIDSLGNQTEWTYDAVGNKLTEKRPDNGVTTNVYDAMNRLTSTTDPENQTTTFTYGGTEAGTFGDNLVTLADAKSNSYGFEYDLLNRKTKMTYPDLSFESWTFNDTAPAGQIATVYRARNAATMSCTLDVRNRDVLCDWSDATPDVTKTYDAADRLLTLNNSTSHLSYTYDAANQLLSETQDLSTLNPQLSTSTVSYTYDADGNRQSLTYPGGTVVEYGYTGRNQVASVTADGPPPLATYQYDLNGNRTGKTLENGTTTSYTYDVANRLTQLAHSNGAGVLAQFDYTLDTVGNGTAKTMEGAGLSAPVTESYGYDATDQLTSVDYGTGRTTGFNYDPVGNRTTVTDSAGIVPASYSANNLNQYTAVDASVPAYDANGNLTSYAGQAFTYDSENRLLSVTGGTTSVSSTYDARRRCVSRTVNGVATYFVWDDWSLIEERAGSGVLATKYVHGPAIDEILIKTDSTATLYYHHDGLGSTVALTDATGIPLETYSYDTYGRPEIQSASGLSLPVSAFQNRFLFTGREWVAEVGFYDYRNRAYSAVFGRFLQTDPIRFEAGDVNLYRYVSNCPTGFADADGLYSSKDEAGRAGAREASRLTAEDKSRVEYCGRVCKCEKGGTIRFYFTGPVPGKKGKELKELEKKLGYKLRGACDVSRSPACDDGDSWVADYHSHPGGSKNSPKDKDLADKYDRDSYVGRKRNRVDIYRHDSR